LPCSEQKKKYLNFTLKAQLSPEGEAVAAQQCRQKEVKIFKPFAEVKVQNPVPAHPPGGGA